MGGNIVMERAESRDYSSEWGLGVSNLTTTQNWKEPTRQWVTLKSGRSLAGLLTSQHESRWSFCCVVGWAQVWGLASCSKCWPYWSPVQRIPTSPEATLGWEKSHLCYHHWFSLMGLWISPSWMYWDNLSITSFLCYIRPRADLLEGVHQSSTITQPAPPSPWLTSTVFL